MSVKIGLVWWEKTFTGAAPFVAIDAARTWLTERGYSVGEMQGRDPMGIMIGDHYDIAKWRNLNATERMALDGQIEGDKRNGPVVVRLKSQPERP